MQISAIKLCTMLLDITGAAPPANNGVPMIYTMVSLFTVILSIVLTTVLNRRKSAAEIKKLDSDSDANNVGLWKQLVEEYRKKVDEITGELKELRTELYRVKDREVEYLQNSMTTMQLNHDLQKQIARLSNEKEALRKRVEELEHINANK